MAMTPNQKAKLLRLGTRSGFGQAATGLYQVDKTVPAERNLQTRSFLSL